jgi:hypothetical protein
MPLGLPLSVPAYPAGGISMIRQFFGISGSALLWIMGSAGLPSFAAADFQRCEELQSRFNAARTHQDAQAMAAVFAKDAVRVTPDGVFQGRDAIRGNLQSLVTAGLRDFTSQRIISRHAGDLLFDAGEWHARLGDLPLHGYYSALLSCGGKPAILQETTNVATPRRR